MERVQSRICLKGKAGDYLFKTQSEISSHAPFLSPCNGMPLFCVPPVGSYQQEVSSIHFPCFVTLPISPWAELCARHQHLISMLRKLEKVLDSLYSRTEYTSDGNACQSLVWPDCWLENFVWCSKGLQLLKWWEQSAFHAEHERKSHTCSQACIAILKDPWEK